MFFQDDKPFDILCMDGAEGLKKLEDKSIKLLYGSPPYPNADRNYGNWSSDVYLDKISPFIENALPKLRDDGFIVINIKANREKCTSKISSRRSLVVEKLAIMMEEKYNLYCVDIEIWVKDNPVPTGVRVACQDAYEQNLWFSKSKKWTINLDAIRRPYQEASLKHYENSEYKPRSNGLPYVKKTKKIDPNPLGALPINVIKGSVSCRIENHQAVQPIYLPQKYILATCQNGDLVVDPWSGSGTTGIAAVTNGCKYIGFDIFEEYANLSRSNIDKAWEDYKKHARVGYERKVLQDYFINCVEQNVTFHSETGLRPVELDIEEEGLITQYRLYIFPATNPPGGRSSDEYKFNLTVPGQAPGQKGNFDWSDERIVLLVAYVKEYDVFVFFDPFKHENFACNSNIQMKVEVFADAIAKGITESKKKNGEIIFACTSKNLLSCIHLRKNKI